MNKSNKNWLWIFIILGIGWGITSIFLIDNFYVAPRIETNTYHPIISSPPTDLRPPGHYSLIGKVSCFPAWLSAQLTTSDGMIYHFGLNKDLENPFLFLVAVAVGAIIFIIIGFVIRKLIKNPPQKINNYTL